MLPTWDLWVAPPMNPPLPPGAEPLAFGEESQQCQVCSKVLLRPMVWSIERACFPFLHSGLQCPATE